MHKCAMPVLTPVQKDLTGEGFFSRVSDYFSRREWILEDDYEFYLPWLGETWFIPKGFVFDGASVPRAFWALIDPIGTLLVGSLFHDFGYRYNCQMVKVSFFDAEDDPDNVLYKVIHEGDGKKFFDEQFRLINNYVNDAKFMNGAAWATLRGFGFLGWNESRKTDLKVRDDYGKFIFN